MELPRATNTSALSSAGVMRLFNKFGETVNKITYKMDENDSVTVFSLSNKYNTLIVLIYIYVNRNFTYNQL